MPRPNIAKKTTSSCADKFNALVQTVEGLLETHKRNDILYLNDLLKAQGVELKILFENRFERDSKTGTTETAAYFEAQVKYAALYEIEQSQQSPAHAVLLALRKAAQKKPTGTQPR